MTELQSALKKTSSLCWLSSVLAARYISKNLLVPMHTEKEPSVSAAERLDIAFSTSLCDVQPCLYNPNRAIMVEADTVRQIRIKTA